MPEQKTEMNAYAGLSCKVGQHKPCGRPAAHSIAVTAVHSDVWPRETNPGGVVPLCEFHAATIDLTWPEIAKPALWAALAEVWEDEPSAAEWELAGLMATRAIEFFGSVAHRGTRPASGVSDDQA
jgi:hypothetical protein